MELMEASVYVGDGALEVQDVPPLQIAERGAHDRRETEAAGHRFRAAAMDFVPGAPVSLGRLHQAGNEKPPSTISV